MVTSTETAAPRHDGCGYNVVCKPKPVQTAANYVLVANSVQQYLETGNKQVQSRLCICFS